MNLKADIEKPLFEISHLYFQTNSLPLGKKMLCLCSRFLDILTACFLFIQCILNELALNGRNLMLFFFLQKGKDTFLEFKTASDFKQQQKCPLA